MWYILKLVSVYVCHTCLFRFFIIAKSPIDNGDGTSFYERLSAFLLRNCYRVFVLNFIKIKKIKIHDNRSKIFKSKEIKLAQRVKNWRIRSVIL